MVLGGLDAIKHLVSLNVPECLVLQAVFSFHVDLPMGNELIVGILGISDP